MNFEQNYRWRQWCVSRQIKSCIAGTVKYVGKGTKSFYAYVAGVGDENGYLKAIPN